MTVKWVQQDPLVLNGEPFCYGSRLTVRQLLELRANGYDLTRILNDHPELRRLGVAAAFTYAADHRERYADFFEADRSRLQRGGGGRPPGAVPASGDRGQGLRGDRDRRRLTGLARARSRAGDTLLVRIRSTNRRMTDTTTTQTDAAAAFDPERRATELAILDALRSVVDPEIGMNVVELALIKQIILGPDSTEIKMILTTPFCPYAGSMIAQVKEQTETVVEHDVKVTLLAERWDPRDAGLMW